MGQVKLATSILMTVLFSLAIVVFTISIGADNNAYINLENDPDYANIQDNITGEVRSFVGDANSSLETGLLTTQESGDQSASSGGQFKVTAASSVRMLKTSLSVGYKKIFGEDSGFGIFLSGLLGMIGFTIGLYIWKTWKGNPD